MSIHLFEKERQLEKIWTEQLYKEYKHICFYYKIKLSQAVIEIRPLEKYFGTWNTEEHKITLSSHVIKNHSWDVVLSILKHEMAHQVVSEIYNHPHEGHGPLFKKVCTRLGIDGWAARDDADLARSGPLSDHHRTLSIEDERLLRRVEKLLSLATSANEHEAQSAMRTVQNLYQKYNFDRLNEKKATTFETLTLRFRKKRLEHFVTLITALLTKHFFVEVIFSSEYCAVDLCEYKIIELLGARQNVLMAEYVFEFLSHRLEREWLTFRQNQHLRGRKNRNDFYVGVLKGFEKKLKEPLHEAESQEFQFDQRALMILNDPGLDDYLHMKHPRISRRSNAARNVNQRVFNAGMAVGHQIVLSKAIQRTSGRGSGTKLLN